MYINKTKSIKNPRSLSQTLVHSTKSPHRTAGSTAPQVLRSLNKSPHRTAGSTAPQVLRSRLLTLLLTRLHSLVFRLQLSYSQSLTHPYTKNSRQRVTCIQSHKSQHHSNHATP